MPFCSSDYAPRTQAYCTLKANTLLQMQMSCSDEGKKNKKPSQSVFVEYFKRSKCWCVLARGLLDGIVLGVAIHLHKDDISLDLICLFLSTRNMPRVTEEEMPLVILFACLSHSSFYCLFNMILTRINLKTLCFCVFVQPYVLHFKQVMCFAYWWWFS